MTSSYQENRSVKAICKPAKGELIFARMSHVEQMSQPFRFEVDLLCEAGDLEADHILGQPLCVSLATTSMTPVRYFHGLVAEFEQSGYSERFHEYRAVVRPWFWFLTRMADCRIFQDKTVPQIFNEVLKQAGFENDNVETRFENTHVVRDYCVQYRETDFNFLSRLLEEEGIFYFFEHSEDKHVMVLTDDVSKCKSVDGYATVPFYPALEHGTPIRERDHLQTWAVQKVFLPGSFASRDYNYQKPAVIAEGTSSISRSYEKASCQVYDYPAGSPVLTSADVGRLAKLRVEELQVGQLVGRGSGDAAGLTTGCLFKLSGHPRSDLDMQYLITSTSIHLSSSSYHAGSGDDGTQFSIAVEAVDARAAYRPARITPKPMIHGTQTAIVVGPSGDEIYTDGLGRIKVQFHWDRVGKKDEKSSCWVRVGQMWAGTGSYGSIFIPRIGAEVIVSFLEGDPDRPIVIGTVYHATNVVPYGLPGNKTQSGIKTSSSPGGDGFNELRFEDKKGSEHIFLHAQKDRMIAVENDETHEVKHDRTKKVDNDETTNIGKDRTESVGGNESIAIEKDRLENVKGNETLSIGKDYSLTISGGRTLSVTKDESISVSGARTDQVTKDEQVNIGKSRTQSIGENDTLSIDKKLAIDAGEEIEIVAGDASITMKKDGTITIKGKDITLSGDGDINIKAGGNVVIKGSKTSLN